MNRQNKIVLQLEQLQECNLSSNHNPTHQQ
jgi:hypothetical protein